MSVEIRLIGWNQDHVHASDPLVIEKVSC